MTPNIRNSSNSSDPTKPLTHSGNTWWTPNEVGITVLYDVMEIAFLLIWSCHSSSFLYAW